MAWRKRTGDRRFADEVAHCGRTECRSDIRQGVQGILREDAEIGKYLQPRLDVERACPAHGPCANRDLGDGAGPVQGGFQIDEDRLEFAVLRQAPQQFPPEA